MNHQRTRAEDHCSSPFHGKFWPAHKWLTILHYYNSDRLSGRQACGLWQDLRWSRKHVDPAKDRECADWSQQSSEIDSADNRQVTAGNDQTVTLSLSHRMWRNVNVVRKSSTCCYNIRATPCLVSTLLHALFASNTAFRQHSASDPISRLSRPARSAVSECRLSEQRFFMVWDALWHAQGQV